MLRCTSNNYKSQYKNSYLKLQHDEIRFFIYYKNAQVQYYIQNIYYKYLIRYYYITTQTFTVKIRLPKSKSNNYVLIKRYFRIVRVASLIRQQKHRQTILSFKTVQSLETSGNSGVKAALYRQV